ncbi:MAG: hypothetical protein ACW98Y_01880 [Candidatus Thorarchaeota archaeon]|jgi:hypothetical protein
MVTKIMSISFSTDKSRFVALTAVFAAMSVVADLILIPSAGIWDSAIFILSPLAGILLGPVAGAVAIGIGSLAGHYIFFRDIYEMVFMIGAPFGAAMSGLIYQRRWRPALGLYSILLLGYFLEPVTWILPLWGIWDILAGFCLLLVFSLVNFRNLWPESDSSQTLLKLLFATIIGLESDILLRVFILVPGQTYWFFYGFDASVLQAIWLAAGILTPLKVAIATIIAVLVGLPLLRQFRSQFAMNETLLLED